MFAQKQKQELGSILDTAIIHTVNKDLALQVSKVTAPQHQRINCFIIYRKHREDKTYKYL